MARLLVAVESRDTGATGSARAGLSRLSSARCLINGPRLGKPWRKQFAAPLAEI